MSSDNSNGKYVMIKELVLYNKSKYNQKLTLTASFLTYMDKVRDATFDLKYLCLHLLAFIFAVELGYYIAFNMLDVKTFINFSLGTFVVVVGGYDVITLLIPILICLTFKLIKKRKSPQFITASLAFASQKIGTKYFIRTVGILLNIVTVTMVSLYLFEGIHCFILLITAVSMMDLFVIGFSLQACGLGEFIINFSEFLTEKYFEPDCHTESYAEIGLQK